VSQTASRPKIGEGKIGAFLSAAIGGLGVLSVLCLRFPAFLITPELRAHYDMSLLRLVLAIAMMAGAGLGGLAILLRGPRRLAAFGLAMLFLATLLGGPYVTYQDFTPPKFYFGLDWLVLDLFFTGVAFGMLEWIFPKVRQEQPPLQEGWKLDLGFFGLNHLTIGVFLVVSTYLAHQYFGWAVNANVQAHVVALPAVVRFLLVILAADFVEFVSRRAYHEVPFLWRIHAIHHSPKAMDWLSGSRLHFLKPLVTHSVVLAPIFLLGFPQETIFAYLIFISVQSVLIHSNIRMDVGWLRCLIVATPFHHWHHTADAEALGKNYTARPPLFDMLFGTFFLPAGRWPRHYGTVKPVPKNMLGQFLYPITGTVAEFLEERAE